VMKPVQIFTSAKEDMFVQRSVCLCAKYFDILSRKNAYMLGTN